MEERYCPTCGTQVDLDARFCPTCGTTLTDADQPQLPPAPAWPEPEPEPEPEGDQAQPEPGLSDEPRAAGEELQRREPPEAPSPSSAATATGPAAPPGAPEAAPTGSPPPAAGDDLPFSWPATLSGWLIGVGAAAGAVALIPSLANAVSLLLFLSLLGVVATIFLAERLPDVPRLRLITLAVTLVGLGVALDRAGFSARGADSILLVAMIAAAGGALLVELDRDRPLPPR